jgi:four helix bundle protein
MENNIIEEKTFQFSLMIIELYKKMIAEKEYLISKQIFRSGTSIGSNVAEAQGGVSKRDFKNKMSISLKEALETRYWLRIITASQLVQVNLENEMTELKSIINILYKIIKTSTGNLSVDTKYYTLNTAPILGID